MQSFFRLFSVRNNINMLITTYKLRVQSSNCKSQKTRDDHRNGNPMGISWE